MSSHPVFVVCRVSRDPSRILVSINPRRDRCGGAGVVLPSLLPAIHYRPITGSPDATRGDTRPLLRVTFRPRSGRVSTMCRPHHPPLLLLLIIKVKLPPLTATDRSPIRRHLCSTAFNYTRIRTNLSITLFAENEGC